MPPTCPFALAFALALAVLLRPALSAGFAGDCKSPFDCDRRLSCVDGIERERDCSDLSPVCFCLTEDGLAASCTDSEDACRDSEVCTPVYSLSPDSDPPFKGLKVCIDKTFA